MNPATESDMDNTNTESLKAVKLDSQNNSPEATKPKGNRIEPRVLRSTLVTLGNNLKISEIAKTAAKRIPKATACPKVK